MKTILSLILAAFLAASTYADLIPLSAMRSLSISGIAATDSFSQSSSSTGLDAFDRTLSDSAIDGIFKATAQAIQNSSIRFDGFSLETHLLTTTQNGFTNPSPLVAGIAASDFEFSFSVLEPQSYELSGSVVRFASAISPPTFDLSLFSPTGLIFEGFIGTPRIGILSPDTYTFRLNTDAVAITDPLGFVSGLDSQLDFRVASVPDTGSTLLLLALGLLGLPVMVRGVERSSRAI